MPKVEVYVVDQAGKRSKLRVPNDQPVGEIVPAVCEAIGQPTSTHDKGQGQREVVLHHKKTGRDLPPERTLYEEGVAAGDVLRLRMEAVAG